MIGLLIAAAALTSFDTGNSLLRECQDDSMVLACTGYITGATDLMAFTSYPICVPKGVDRGQLRDIVVKDLVAHPEGRQSPAGLLIIKALGDAFPCSK